MNKNNVRPRSLSQNLQTRELSGTNDNHLTNSYCDNFPTQIINDEMLIFQQYLRLSVKYNG